MNVVILNGNVCEDIELRYTPGGKAYINNSLAVRSYNEKTDFIRFKIWAKTAEIFSQYIEKGDKITIQGKIKTESYQKDGKQLYYTYVLVDELSFGFKPKGEQSGN